jgi:starvation-inducible outer membrane lipoprotein
MAVQAFVLITAITLAGCSSDAFRVQGQSPEPVVAPMSKDAERKHIIEQGQDFCERNPDDFACPSKGRR